MGTPGKETDASVNGAYWGTYLDVDVCSLLCSLLDGDSALSLDLDLDADLLELRLGFVWGERETRETRRETRRDEVRVNIIVALRCDEICGNTHNLATCGSMMPPLAALARLRHKLTSLNVKKTVGIHTQAYRYTRTQPGTHICMYTHLHGAHQRR